MTTQGSSSALSPGIPPSEGAPSAVPDAAELSQPDLPKLSSQTIEAWVDNSALK